MARWRLTVSQIWSGQYVRCYELIQRIGVSTNLGISERTGVTGMTVLLNLRHKTQFCPPQALIFHPAGRLMGLLMLHIKAELEPLPGEQIIVVEQTTEAHRGTA